MTPIQKIKKREIDFITKKNHCFEVLMGLDKGFVPIQKIVNYATKPESSMFSDGTFAFISFNWRFFKSGY
ncbi:hypothetical protein DNU06_06175 [Putridiphycobacter roseus]|uniref:Uncharacterized protein n=1 Tax=Putridiphycobacter roseus TaxID=2219161 RepID=A0A2W1NTX6_9FLAO|nr:hypothetical protein [Putridiphycobacter roseus]PZE18198.1 hypothetical protein DNU06_06175 [Putridiphycobacter roseus]